MEEMTKVDIEKVVGFSSDSILENLEPGDTNRSGFRKVSNFKLQSCVVRVGCHCVEHESWRGSSGLTKYSQPRVTSDEDERRCRLPRGLGSEEGRSELQRWL